MSKSGKDKSVGRKVLSSPLIVVLAVATATVFVLAFAGYARRGGFWSPEVEARVFNERGKVRGRDGQGANNGRPVFAFQGEVYDEAEQVRDSAALAMGSTLLAAQRVLDRSPFVDVKSLLSGVIGEGLLPPGLSQDSGSTSASSEQAVYYIRYRAEPLSIEVLSIGKGDGARAAVLVRLPDDGFSENALTYYVISKGGTPMPAAFTPVAQLMESGWRPESFKAADVSNGEKEQQSAWLAARAAAVRKQ